MLNNQQVLRQKLLHLVDEMPADQLQEVIHFADYLLSRKRTQQTNWPPSFFDAVYGSTADDLLEEPNELAFENRDPIS